MELLFILFIAFAFILGILIGLNIQNKNYDLKKCNDNLINQINKLTQSPFE
jgi:hypothetical protein